VRECLTNQVAHGQCADTVLTIARILLLKSHYTESFFPVRHPARKTVGRSDTPGCSLPCLTSLSMIAHILQSDWHWLPLPHHRPKVRQQISPSPADRRFSLRPSAQLRDEPDEHDGLSDELAAEFSRLVNERGHRVPSADQASGVPSASPLASPAAVVAGVMDALKRNDWPETDAGVRFASANTLPSDEGDALTSYVDSRKARNWGATKRWLDQKEFAAMLHSTPYSVMLECDSWCPASQVIFPSSRSESRAVQAVLITSTDGRQYTFSFCLERIDTGSMKGCWMIAGVRQGDYSV
jgi:hypothetical protein